MADENTIPAIACRQWLTDWANYPFPEDHARAKPPEELIVFSMPARLLRKLSGVYVRKREGGLATGIQRAHEKERSDKIAEYVQAGYPFGDLSKKQKIDPENSKLKKPGWLPTAIVVNILTAESDRRGKKVAPKDLIAVTKVGNGSAMTLTIPKDVTQAEWQPENFPPIEVIDGQHRLFAFNESSGLPEDFELPVVAFHGLDIGWQAYLFWSINVSPKKINPSHAYDLFPLLRTQDWLEATPSAHVYREARAQELTELLYRHPQSPWYGRINMLGDRRTGWVSQAAWVQSIFNSFLSLGTTARSRKGLFASNISPSLGPLEWSRPQQAAFLIFLWAALQHAIAQKKDGWPNPLRQTQGEPLDLGDNHDPAFVGSKTLLNQDQGIRGLSLALNDLLWSQAVTLKLDQWECEQVDAGETRDEDIDSCLESIRQQEFFNPVIAAISCLADFDWRTYDAPDLPEIERQIKAGYRGTGGYSRIRTALLKEVSKLETSFGNAAKNLLASEGD